MLHVQLLTISTVKYISVVCPPQIPLSTFVLFYVLTIKDKQEMFTVITVVLTLPYSHTNHHAFSTFVFLLHVRVSRLDKKGSQYLLLFQFSPIQLENVVFLAHLLSYLCAFIKAREEMSTVLTLVREFPYSHRNHHALTSHSPPKNSHSAKTHWIRQRQMKVIYLYKTTNAHKGLPIQSHQ